MSSVPPTTPPGGAPPPVSPHGPWKARNRAWPSGYPGAYAIPVPSVVGPIVLIVAGVVALLVLTGTIPASGFWSWYGRWWPLLLIGAGLALLGEWALDLRQQITVRRGGSYVIILLVFVLLGLGAAGWNSFQGPWHVDWDGHNEDLFNMLGLPEHDNDQPMLNAKIPANATIDIQNPRGDVSVTASDEPTIQVLAHQVAYASSDEDAKKVFDAETVHLTASGSAVLVKSEANSSGRVNLTVTVPRNARVTVESGKGDVSAAGLGAGFRVTASGDVHLNNINGPVEAHFSKGNHDFTVQDLRGDLTADGNLNDVTLSGIRGKVTQNGEILGDVHMEAINGPVHLHTSVTDLEVAELPGDLTLNSDDLRINQAKGAVRVVTHSKDVDLNQIYGDSSVENRDGNTSIEPAGAYAVNVKNSKGDVALTLPPNASASVNVHVRNGDIVSDFAMPSAEGENKSVTFQVGSGGSRIALSADNGDVRIKKGPAFPAAPVASATATKAPATVKATATAKARHLKTRKALPAHPVTQ